MYTYTLNKMVPKVYVSGSWSECVKINEIMKKLEEICEITHNWTIHEDISLLNNSSYIKCQAILAENGIARADYLVAIMDSENVSYVETWTEIGIAIGSGITVLIYNPNFGKTNKINIHTYNAGVKVFPDMNEIVNYLSN